MMNEVIAIDPLGKTVHLLPGILFSENEDEGVYDGATTVIKKPALLVEVNENNETRFYYFRSIGWNKTLLLTTRLHQGRWEAFKCVNNPSSEMISALLKKGKQII